MSEEKKVLVVSNGDTSLEAEFLWETEINDFTLEFYGVKAFGFRALDRNGKELCSEYVLLTEYEGGQKFASQVNAALKQHGINYALSKMDVYDISCSVPAKTPRVTDGVDSFHARYAKGIIM